jgi:hypothetical protein
LSEATVFLHLGPAVSKEFWNVWKPCGVAPAMNRTVPQQQIIA